MKNFYIVIFSFLLILLAVLFIFIQPSSKKNYQNGDYLLQNQLVLEQLDFQDSFSQANLEAGWAKLSLVPPFSTPIAIDDHRGGRHFEGVRDTVYTRSIVLSNENQKVAIVSADLLIIPPLVSQILDTILYSEGFSLENIYLSATHSHSSIGGWQNSFVGEIFAGEYDERVPLFIAQKIAKSILKAEMELQQTDVHFLSVSTQNLVFNRLVGAKGKVDDKIRGVSFERKDGTKAIWFTFAAHCTYFHEEMMKLSADWAGEAVLKIEEKIPQSFAMYSAGAVGSHGPIEFSENQSDNVQQMGKAIAEIISENLENANKISTLNLNLNTLPLFIPQPTFLLSPNWQIRPFWFKKIFGEVNIYIQILQIGEVLFLSMPADFSGELMEELEFLAKENKIHFGLTSFNGTYVGYITADEWNKMNSYETTTMNWLGHGSGGFFKSLNKTIILKASTSNF
jgi:hypothetical protein